jgi:glyoxalase family protein
MKTTETTQTTPIPGIHHVTAIASDPQQNVDFYTGVLGLRLVKVTINYDDPGSYHFYYGDTSGSPGTILTFFAWPGGHRGRPGTAQVTTTAFSVPEGSLGYWQERFTQHNIRHEPIVTRWNEQVLTFTDPDGLRLELVAHREAENKTGWQDGPVPLDAATRGFHSVALSLQNAERTVGLLTQTMGFTLLGQELPEQEGTRARYTTGEQDAARIVDILTRPAMPQGTVAVGNVHHIAWRTPNDAAQEAWQELLMRQRYQVSPVMDRQYFHSIYFREPGGVLFEIATDTPGFTADESLAQLGTHLKLPDWLEAQRPQVEQALPILRLPRVYKEVLP